MKKIVFLTILCFFCFEYGYANNEIINNIQDVKLDDNNQTIELINNNQDVKPDDNNQTIEIINNNYSVPVQDKGEFLDVDASGGNITISLPDAVTAGNGFLISI